MGTHRDWWKPICFIESDNECIWSGSFHYEVTYGMPNWINRCEWIVPGTIEC